ncbi:MAG: hypothetical protein ACLSEY_00265 [Enterocloster sp.]
MELKDCPEVWELESYYIAQALADYIMILSPPKKIILGRRHECTRPHLFPRRSAAKVKEFVNWLYPYEGDGGYGLEDISFTASLHDDPGASWALSACELNALEAGTAARSRQPVSALKGIGEKTGKLFEKRVRGRRLTASFHIPEPMTPTDEASAHRTAAGTER